ncbi:MAG: hypothetical protein UX62_C0018G0010 [Microgenomates group bacterium GW2011_GWA2_46_7]|nr:MAG: hypothetical protein UX62_C0018G0010 [Microgenomates group bacterium GW2011_GWA2_46_7]
MLNSRLSENTFVYRLTELFYWVSLSLGGLGIAMVTFSGDLDINIMLILIWIGWYSIYSASNIVRSSIRYLFLGTVFDWSWIADLFYPLVGKESKSDNNLLRFKNFLIFLVILSIIAVGIDDLNSDNNVYMPKTAVPIQVEPRKPVNVPSPTPYKVPQLQRNSPLPLGQ